MSPKRLSLRDLNRATLARQLLLERTRLPVLGAVERLAGLQAQLARPPFVALWSRLAGFRREQLAALVERRRAVRATFFRHTIHLVSARDYLAFRGTIQAALDRLASGPTKRVRTDRSALVAEARTLLLERPRTYGELRAELVARHPREDPSALAFAVRTHLALVQLPGSWAWSYPPNAELAVAEAWLGEAFAEDGADAREALALRYLAAFGPATAADLRMWSGVPGLREPLERLRPRLVALRDEEGRELLDLPRAPRPGGDVPAPVRFLPDFDNLLLGHADRRRVIPLAHRPAFASMNGMVPGAVLVDGFVAATWRVERKGKASRLEVRPLERLDQATRRALEEEGQALAEFLDPEARIEVRIAGVAPRVRRAGARAGSPR